VGSICTVGEGWVSTCVVLQRFHLHLLLQLTTRAATSLWQPDTVAAARFAAAGPLVPGAYACQADWPVSCKVGGPGLQLTAGAGAQKPYRSGLHCACPSGLADRFQRSCALLQVVPVNDCSTAAHSARKKQCNAVQVVQPSCCDLVALVQPFQLPEHPPHTDLILPPGCHGPLLLRQMSCQKGATCGYRTSTPAARWRPQNGKCSRQTGKVRGS
jgi:hypothetical protein